MVRAGLALSGALLLVSTAASGSVETESGYTKGQAYNAALRYLRVDLSYEVTEKDADAAYLLFRYVPPGRRAATNGAIEIVEQQKGVRVSVRLADMPRYQEQLLSDGLQHKLRAEYGEPPRRVDPPPKEPRPGQDGPGASPDGGAS